MQLLTILILNLLLISPARQTESPHGSDFKVSCSTCHSSKGWQLDKEIYSFNHNTTAMPLKGQHTQVSCRQCHPTLVFSQAKTECSSCHADVHQSTVGPDCSRCHNSNSWLVNNINEIHQMSRFPLTGVHRTADCYQCHKSENHTRFDVPGINCIDCHRQSFLAATNPNHVDAGYSEDCYTCHPSNSFQWLGVKINHDRFPLVMGHSGRQCSDCHKTGKYADLNQDCYSCHDKDYLATKNPDHNASALSKNCLDCHTLNPGWKPANFDHSIFPLTLGHAAPKCSDCHIGGNYSTTQKECYSCHQKDYMGAKEPDHNASGISTTCTDCHTTNLGWKPTTFNHSLFPLTLGHAIPKCSDCHIGGNYTTTPIDCYSCHKQNFLATKEPDHTAAGFAITCTDCHTTNPGWKPTNFNHSQFPLTLGHSVPTCSDCHKSNYTNLPSDCYSCHQQNFLATTDPNHVTSGFAHTCADCHTTNPGWKPSTFSHTQFPLTSGHAIPTCNDCHKGNYTSTPSDCYSCHQQNFLATTDPNHTTSGFSHTCTDCHTTNPGWRPTTFSHTQFPLTLGHATPTCADCHKGNYTSIPADCYSCHSQNFLSTTDPNHTTSGFSHTCTDCHNTNPGWKPATFNHTQFPLTLGHATPSCADCHKGNYTSTPADCYSCHSQNFLATTDPNHTTSGFSHTCTDCHNTNPGWKPATFNHTQFPLTLGHATPGCADCHKGNYTSTSADCYSCHSQNFLATTDPNHTTSGFTHTCTDCHTTNPGWKPATFSHTQFPLTQGHSGPSCADCHKGNYTSTSTDCIACHQGDYNATVNPNHKTLSFSTSCKTCHTTAPGWKPASYTQHDSQFPIYSGKHKGQWSDCSECHANPSNYSVFTCIDCHAHNKTDMDNKHRGEVSGYSWVSSECFRCHPRGSAGG